MTSGGGTSDLCSSELLCADSLHDYIIYSHAATPVGSIPMLTSARSSHLQFAFCQGTDWGGCFRRTKGFPSCLHGIATSGGRRSGSVSCCNVSTPPAEQPWRTRPVAAGPTRASTQQVAGLPHAHHWHHRRGWMIGLGRDRLKSIIRVFHVACR